MLIHVYFDEVVFYPRQLPCFVFIQQQLLWGEKYPHVVVTSLATVTAYHVESVFMSNLLLILMSALSLPSPSMMTMIVDLIRLGRHQIYENL